MRTINLCCISAACSLFLFSCSTSSYSTSSVPQKLAPAQQTLIWKDGIPIPVDTSHSVQVMVRKAWHEDTKYAFDLDFENKGHHMVELNPDKFYTLQSPVNGKRMGAYAFTVEDIEKMKREREAQVDNDGAIFMLLFLPIVIAGAIFEGERVNNMSKEDRQAYEQQQTLDRIERNQRQAEDNRRHEREMDRQIAYIAEQDVPLMKRHTLMPGEKREGRVFFPALAGTDSLKLMLPMGTDTLQFRYSVIR